MPKNRIQFSDDFVLSNQNVGIGTSVPTDRLHVVGTHKSSDLRISGVSTSRSYSGFINQKKNVLDDTTLDATGGDSNTLSNEIIVGEGKTLTLTGNTKSNLGFVDSLEIDDRFIVPVGETQLREPNPVEGMVRFNKDLGCIEFWNGFEWRQVVSFESSTKGIFSGGITPGFNGRIETINISSTGNTTLFGQLETQRCYGGGCGSEIRGVMGGGLVPGPSHTNIIEYFSFAESGRTVDFGDLTVGRAYLSSFSSSTRGVWAGGYTPTPVGTVLNTIDYVSITTTGNAADFGDLTVAKLDFSSGCSSAVRGIVAGGSGVSNVIEYVTIASTGNAQDFGDITVGRSDISGCSNSTRGIFAAGLVPTADPTSQNIIDYITIASVGNAVDFGDLTVARRIAAAVSSSTRGVFAGGINITNTIDYVNIASSSNALDFGDLTGAYAGMQGNSNSHGGLGGF